MTEGVNTVEFPCPECGKNANVATDTENPVVFHEIPYCTRFDAIQTCEDVINYVRDGRLKLEN